MKMPVSRDVSVRRPPEPLEDREGASGSRSSPCLVTVMGFDRKDVLFRSDEVGTVQWRDSTGDIVALLVRLRPNVWGFSRRGDDDWQEILGIYGNPDAT